MHQQRMVAAPLPADPTPLRARPRRKPRRFRAGLRASPAPRSHSAAAGAGSQWDRSHARPAHFWCRSGDAKDALEAVRLTPALWRCCALPGGPANVGERGLDEAGGWLDCHRGVRVPGRRRQRDQGWSVGLSNIGHARAAQRVERALLWVVCLRCAVWRAGALYVWAVRPSVPVVFDIRRARRTVLEEVSRLTQAPNLAPAKRHPRFVGRPAVVGCPQRPSLRMTHARPILPSVALLFHRSSSRTLRHPSESGSGALFPSAPTIVWHPQRCSYCCFCSHGHLCVSWWRGALRRMPGGSGMRRGYTKSLGLSAVLWVRQGLVGGGRIAVGISDSAELLHVNPTTRRRRFSWWRFLRDTFLSPSRPPAGVLAPK